MHLLIAATARCARKLEAQANEVGLSERIHFLGFLGQQEIVEAVLDSEIFVLTSSHGDPSPKALSEALFLRRPAVCSDGIGTCRDVIEEAVNGYIVETANFEQLADRIAKILADDTLRASMGERSHQIARRDDFRAGIDSLAQHLDGIQEPENSAAGR